MAKVPTTICQETAFNGEKEMIWLRATKVYQWQARNSNRGKKKEKKKKEHLLLDEGSLN